MDCCFILFSLAGFAGLVALISDHTHDEIRDLQLVVQALERNVTECRTVAAHMAVTQQTSLPEMSTLVPWFVGLLVLSLFGLLVWFAHKEGQKAQAGIVAVDAAAARHQACHQNGHSKMIVLVPDELTIYRYYCSGCKHEWPVANKPPSFC